MNWNLEVHLFQIEILCKFILLSLLINLMLLLSHIIYGIDMNDALKG